MPSNSAHDSEAQLRNLASLVAECRELAGKLDRLDEVGRQTAPFLFRQLGQSLQLLDQSVKKTMEHGQGSSAPASSSEEGHGLFGKLKRSLLGTAKKDEGEKETREGLQGNSWTIAIPELIAFLSNARKTGALWVHAPNETFLIQLRQGVLLHAASDSTPQGERLGEILVSMGALSQSDLSAFLANSEGAGMLGVTLHRNGTITEEALHDALAAQVQRLFTRMLSARTSVFRFQEGAELLVEHHIQLNCMQLLLETARMFDESQYKNLEQAAIVAEPGGAMLDPEATDMILDEVLGDSFPEPIEGTSPIEEPESIDPSKNEGDSAKDAGDRLESAEQS